MSLELFQHKLNKMKIKEFTNMCENGSPLTSKQKRMKFIKRAFVFFGFVWCFFMIVSRVMKRMKENKKKLEDKKD